MQIILVLTDLKSFSNIPSRLSIFVRLDVMGEEPMFRASCK